MLSIRSTGAGSSSSTATEDSHKNEGFLKSIWHNLTGEHDTSKHKEQQEDKKNDDPKKGPGSGSA